MKKWKQLVVFVMILTMVMGMTIFAAPSSTGSESATASGSLSDPVPDPDTPQTPAASDATGTINHEEPIAATDAMTVLVNGKEAEVELVVQPINETMDNDEIELVTNKLVAQAGKLTGFQKSENNKTFLFDVDLQIKGGGAVGSSLQQAVEVSLNCKSMNFPSGTTKDNLRVLHYSWSKKAWEKRTITSYVDGILTAEFDSFSPVAVVYSDKAVVDPDTKLSQTEDEWKLTSGTQGTKYNVITLKWNRLGDRKTRYELGIFNSAEDVNPFKIVSTKKNNYKFTKAVCGKDYVFRIIVKGSSVWSDPCYGFTTLEGKGAPKISSVKTTYNSITIKWKKVKGVQLYAIYDVADPENPIATVKGGSLKLKGVATGVTFNYFVRPVKGESFGDASAVATGTTALQPVSNVKVKGADSASVKVSWKKVKGATSYYVEQWDGSEYRPINGDAEKAYVTKNSTVISGLNAGTTYKYRVTPVRGCYEGRAAEGQGRTKNLPK